ncbi:hypothetical protein C923_00927 [Plasmodium falciparum UGT5.1]|uniref:Erythrocyte membrane protein 1 n=1 Tax=Plasmodium falciparum UGT5.1 TaxID=1237627 RepID=W7JTI1_PLAFA|nr:hypothetical protein C923_00927 [Plasmodium falciparum UGT5.1]
MARDPRGGGSEEDDIDHKSVKHLLDSIGKKVHEEVINGDAAKKYIEALKGNLQEAKGMGETVSSLDPCKLVKQYYEHLNGDATNSDPCGNRTGKEEVNRFSDTLGGQCTDHRIKGNERNKTGGACAPLRRLHLCNKNMEKIATSMTKHDLLAEVCMAAKFEGQSIKTHYPKYEALYEGSGFTTCTMLARSFADIGDIVRGRDLYLGYDDEEKKQRDELEDNLKGIFKQIHEGLTNGELKTRYNDGSGNYFQLREDWWDANRETVWKAITCDVKSGSQYFRQTCGSGNWTKDNCRCDGSNADQVPTYFDYVPQYLRWFEEWAEDFCRKKKHKLKDAIQKCREKDKSGEERYCDLNRHDCKKTVRGEHVFFEESDCNDCSVACKPFVKWIDNQKLEFLKQKRKYTSEIKKYTNGTTNSKRKKRSTKSETYEGYEKKFYEQLKTDYGTVNKFLEKLNEEDVCKKITDEKEGIIHFEKVNSSSASGDGSNKTFDHTEYCQACPWCGAQKENGGKGWKAKNDGECGKGKEYGNYENTQIPILTGDKGQLDMVRKYKKFCNGNGGNGATGTVNGGAPGGKGEKSKNGASGKNGDNITETWTCYYYKKNEKDVGNGAINFCVQQKQDNHEKKKYSMSYNAFFWDWVYHMLHDSLDWRNELKSCIDKDKSEQCENKCNSKCDCFLKWVNEKKTEWKAIKDHFGKQKDIEQQTKMDTGVTLELLLEKDLLLKSIEDTHVDANDIEHIRKMLKDEETEENVDTGTEQKSIIDKLLNHEERIAKKCKETHTNDICPIPNSGGARAGEPRVPTEEEEDDEEESDHGEDDAEEEEEETEDGKEDQDTTVDGKGATEEVEETHKATEETITTPDVCATVAEALAEDNLEKACPTKYGPGGKEKFPNWKCIPTSGDKTATSSVNGDRSKRDADSADGAPSGKDTGSICVPPRRRRLYVKKLHDWAEKQSSQPQALSGQATVNGVSTSPQAGGEPQVSTSATASSTSSLTDATQLLRQAFIESAAVETFFLWHKYKAENTKTQGGVGSLPLQLLNRTLENSDDSDPENQLKRGNIPIDFLRQMFYTLGDYRDICVGNTDIVVNASTEDQKTAMQKIKENIEKLLPKNGGTPPSVTTPQQTWWEKNAKDIWEGMLCALSYDTNTKNGEPPQQVKTANGEELFDTLKTQYGVYESVKLEEEASGAMHTTQASPASGEKTYLSKFVLRPPYFRYLEEWGQNFCKERTKRLEKIRGECRSDKVCSGDGLKCNDPVPKNEEIFEDFLCPTCARHCRSYRKWIERKKYEFTEQANAYKEQKKNCKNESENTERNNHGNGFCVTLKSLSDAGEFLQRLRSCSKTDNDNGKGKKIFDDEGDTFKHAKNCSPCSEFKIKCENGNCGGDTKGKCNGRTSITKDDIEQMRSSTEEVDMYVSDNSKKDFESDLKEACQTSGIFKGIRKDVWKCGEVCGVDICNLKKKDNIREEGDEHIIMKELLQRWLEYFFEDYNKIKHKISHCTKNGKGSKCIKGCVDEWITKKKDEWQKINDNYLKKYKSEDDGSNDLTNFLQQAPFHDEVLKAIKPCGKLDDFVSKQCNATANSEKVKDGNKSYVIDCMLNKLQQKAKNCETQPSGSDCTPSTENPSSTQPDDEDLVLEEENQVAQPKFCPPVEELTETDTGEKCDEEKDKEKKDGEKEEESETKTEEDGGPPAPPPPEPEEETAPVKPPTKPQRPRKPRTPELLDDPLLKTALMSSTIMWSIGIAFAAFTYFYLKKKTKASVGNLFQILQIPKSDYGTPTPKSKNRYIPYVSDRYKGKTYIYMEGDTSGDDDKYAFMSDTTDVTSSESEYEEMDINDIYVPGSPKYKTLIEVVLEPSKRDTFNTPSDIPLNDKLDSNKLTDEEWNQLKHDFISQYVQRESMGVPQYDESTQLPMNIVGNVFGDKMDEKPFITSIHDRDLYNGEEYNYNVNMVNNDIPMSGNNDTYSGIDLINDSLNNNKVDIYDEVLKRKENELFGTNHVKHTTINRFAKPARDDPIHNQLELFHKWLDRHRDMCEKWDTNNKKEELLDKLKEEWNKKSNNNSDLTHTSSNIPSGENSIKNVLNTDVSIQIDMDDPKPINEFTNMDNIIDNLEKNSEPYYDIVEDDIIYFDIDDERTPMDHNNMDNNKSNVPTKVQIEMNVINKQELFQEEFPISDIWNI